jgi:Xaa-Pro dipeptidase
MQLFDYERATQLMRTAGIDLVLASTKHNVGYLSDYWHPVSDDYYLLWDTTATHKTLVGLPTQESRDAFLVAGASEATAVALMDPWIDDRRFWGPGYYIQTWPEPLATNPDPGDPMDVVAEAIKEKLLDRATIAVEERYLGVRYARRLQELLPDAKLVDAEAVLWQLRMVKCDEELRRLRVACERTCKVWLSTVRAAEEGMTEIDMQRDFARRCLLDGIECERAYVIFGPAGLQLVNGSPPPRGVPLERGMFIRIDAQGKFEGYVANLSRIVGFGEVSAGMAAAHAIERNLVEAMIPALKPGVACSKVRETELALYPATNYPPVVPYTGHGVGRVVHEPPYFALNDHTRLAPNMVVTLEPTICHSDGGDIFVSIEDQFVITPEGSEWLTREAPLDLYV